MRWRLKPRGRPVLLRNGLLLRTSPENSIEVTGVFDFDEAIFSTLYETWTKAVFLPNTRYFIPVHRPLWSAFKV